LMFLYAKKEKSVFGRYKSAILFSTFAFVFNICGVITTKILVTCNLINQTEMGVIKNVETHLSDRISTSVSSLLSFIGFVAPTSTFSILEITTALFTTVLVIAVLILIFTVTIRNNIHPQLTFIVLFFVIGITAVFISGLVFITLRPAYFFCWNLLTSVCVLYLIEFEPLKHQTYNNIKKDLLSV